jgi:hypothetical protein
MKVRRQILGNHFFSQIVLFSNDPPLSIAWLREYFDPIFVPELELKDSTNTASSASYLELYSEKIDSEGRLRTKLFDIIDILMMLEKYLLESECVFI